MHCASPATKHSLPSFLSVLALAFIVKEVGCGLTSSTPTDNSGACEHSLNVYEGLYRTPLNFSHQTLAYTDTVQQMVIKRSFTDQRAGRRLAYRAADEGAEGRDVQCQALCTRRLHHLRTRPRGTSGRG